MNPLIIGGIVAIVYIATRKTGSSSVRASRNFTFAELSRTSTGIPNDPTPEAKAWLEATALEILEPIRAKFGPIIINSGYRSQEVNTRIGGSPTSQHMLGQAADIVSPNATPYEIVNWIYSTSLPVRQVILYPPSEGNFVHVAIDPQRPAKRQFLQKNGAFAEWRPS
jgi:uncharacterized protein YcbK (DUF882 family)